MRRHVTITRQSWPLKKTFTIARGSKTTAETLIVAIREGNAVGYGESVPYARYGESLDSAAQQIIALQNDFERGLGRVSLQQALPPGAARNAVDCALWDLEVKESQLALWQLVGLQGPAQALETTFTLGLNTPEAMAADAIAHSHHNLLKLKLTGEGDLERVRAVRAAAPDNRLIVDVNEGWEVSHYDSFTPEFAALGVAALEQPFPAGQDHLLDSRPRPVPLCADESCHDRHSLQNLQGRYDMINIKLDKTGGLTEALALKQDAQNAGFDIMVGCMVASSLAMAPAFFVAQGAQIVDLDGPLLLAEEADPRFHFEGGFMHPPPPTLWG